MRKGSYTYEQIKRENYMIDMHKLGGKTFKLYEDRIYGDAEPGVLVCEGSWYLFTYESIWDTLNNIEDYEKYSL